jgi:hypothetical protein
VPGGPAAAHQLKYIEIKTPGRDGTMPLRSKITRLGLGLILPFYAPFWFEYICKLSSFDCICGLEHCNEYVYGSKTKYICITVIYAKQCAVVGTMGCDNCGTWPLATFKAYSLTCELFTMQLTGVNHLQS